jgi:hypothetical protein
MCRRRLDNYVLKEDESNRGERGEDWDSLLAEYGTLMQYDGLAVGKTN